MPASRASASIVIPRSPWRRTNVHAACRVRRRFSATRMSALVSDTREFSSEVALNELNEYSIYRSIRAGGNIMSDQVLLTGISGFLGGHVALALLGAGYTVRGSIRNPAKADHVRATLGKAGADLSRLNFVTLD